MLMLAWLTDIILQGWCIFGDVYPPNRQRADSSCSFSRSIEHHSPYNDWEGYANVSGRGKFQKLLNFFVSASRKTSDPDMHRIVTSGT